MENQTVQYQDRKEVERVILAQIISNNDLGPATSLNISQQYFTTYRDLADHLWNTHREKGFVPTKKTIKTLFKKFDGTPPENESEVKEAAAYLQDFHCKDKLVEKLMGLKTGMSDNNPDGWKKILDEWPADLARINSIRDSSSAKDYAADAEERYKYVESRKEQRENRNYRVNFAHGSMNDHFGGYEPGFYLYVARTGKGKTWTCLLDLWWTWYHGRTLDKPVNVGLFSLEMDINKVGLRLDTFENHFSNYDLNRGIIRRDKNIDDDAALEKEADSYRNYIETISTESKEGKRGKFKIWTQEMFNGPITPTRIEALIKEEDLDFVVVDQLELVDPDSRTGDERARLNEVSRAFKKMSGRLGIPILVPHQMNRETVKAKEVTDANVAGSDGPARHAEFVCYLTKDETNNAMLYKFLKARNAPTNREFALEWDWDTGVYKEVNDNTLLFEHLNGTLHNDQRDVMESEPEVEEEEIVPASGW